MGGSIAAGVTGELGPAGLHRFKRYPTYKESGVEWLGNIPAHWDVTSIRSLARLGYKTFTDGDWIESPFIRNEGIRLLQTGNIGIGTYKEQGFRYIDEETFRSFRCTEVLPGDVLICRLADPVGRACLAPELGCRMITSVDVCILKAAVDIEPAFVVFALSGVEYLSWMSGICRGGTRDRVSRSMLGSIKIQIPPPDEQRAVVAFLDQETARIDALVAKKERLIELLQEKRTALITQAVTKGLDPSVPMKDSDVEGLRESPAHWEVMKTTWLFSIGSGTTPASEDTAYYGGDTPWITTSELRESVIVATEKTVTNEALRDYPSLKVHPSGSVAVAMYGATIGRLGILGVPATVNQACCVFSSARGIESQFWFYWLQMRRPYLISLGYGGGQPNLSQELLRSVRVPTPPVCEQRTIAVFLDRETARIDALVSKVRAAIDCLKELRAAIVSAAVTGKIDVRAAA
jgi:type I restriction enzyme, S subunit